MSSASATRTTPRLERVGLAASAVADDRVQDLGDDDAPLRLLVAALEQVVEAVGHEEQAVCLVVGAVDRHPDVVQEGAPGDHYLGVALGHPVVGDHCRLDPRLVEESEQAQGDVENHLDVDPRVVRHPEALGV